MVQITLRSGKIINIEQDTILRLDEIGRDDFDDLCYKLRSNPQQKISQIFFSNFELSSSRALANLSQPCELVVLSIRDCKDVNDNVAGLLNGAHLQHLILCDLEVGQNLTDAIAEQVLMNPDLLTLDLSRSIFVDYEKIREAISLRLALNQFHKLVFGEECFRPLEVVGQEFAQDLPELSPYDLTNTVFKKSVCSDPNKLADLLVNENFFELNQRNNDPKLWPFPNLKEAIKQRPDILDFYAQKGHTEYFLQLLNDYDPLSSKPLGARAQEFAWNLASDAIENKQSIAFFCQAMQCDQMEVSTKYIFENAATILNGSLKESDAGLKEKALARCMKQAPSLIEAFLENPLHEKTAVTLVRLAEVFSYKYFLDPSERNNFNNALAEVKSKIPIRSFIPQGANPAFSRLQATAKH